MTEEKPMYGLIFAASHIPSFRGHNKLEENNQFLFQTSTVNLVNPKKNVNLYIILWLILELL